MSPLIPCLWFNGQAEDAANFYVSIFPDSAILDVSRYGEGAPMPAGEAMVVRFRLNGQELMILNGGPHHQLTPAFSLTVPCRDQAETDRYWAALSEGGEEIACGWLTDRFGVSWQVVPDEVRQMLGDPDKAKAGRAMEAMMSMKKLEIAPMRRAFEGGDGGA
jgi:predicted 3-demethylubiquinone-9 3-methyltransferase (glyoxalase superfamily)